MEAGPLTSKEKKIGHKLELGDFKQEQERNNVYISNPPSPNPLVHNKGNTRKKFSKIRTFEFDKKLIEEIFIPRNNADLNSNITYIDEEKHIPAHECIELDKCLSAYLFGFSEHLSNKTMKILNIKNKSLQNDKKNRSSTPLYNSKETSILKEKLFENMWFDSQFKYKTLCLKFKENYFEEILKNQKIFLQYIEIANSENKITRSISFKKKAAINELNKNTFARDIKIYGSKIK